MSAEEALPSRVPPAEAAALQGRPVPPDPAPSQPRRRGPGELEEEVEAALRKVPEEFDRNDVCQALGYEPERASLYRILQRFRTEGRISVLQNGNGRAPTIYCKISELDSPSQA
jgi:hypothetical protein